MPFLTPDAPPNNVFVVRRLRIPQQIDWLGIVNGALMQLTNWFEYEVEGSLTPKETAQIMADLYDDYMNSSGFMIGQITPYVTALPPVYCIDCDGGTYARTDYPELYALINPVFILDADTFTTPPLNFGRVPLGAGISVETTDFVVGQIGGEENHALTEAENASHSHVDAGHVHVYQPPGATGLFVSPGEVPALLPALLPSNTGSGSAAIQSSGSGTPHNTIQPYVALKFCVVAR